MNLVLFDFDGTLTTKDSLDEFLKYSVGMKKYMFNMLIFLPIFILYKLKLIKNNIAKEKLFKLFFYGIDEMKFKNMAKKYSLEKLDLILNDDRLSILKQHQKNNDRVVIVSASIECWLKPWCEKHNVELLSTKLKFIDNKFTGKFSTKNCYGNEKVNRIKNYLNISEYDTIYAYGDSAGDYKMLELAQHKTFFTN
ncbi:MAG: HAD family hydrolase [Campylobacterota bacterium]|nr:HAD family hydrolase [Campylobacterota bacterium]